MDKLTRYYVAEKDKHLKQQALKEFPLFLVVEAAKIEKKDNHSIY